MEDMQANSHHNAPNTSKTLIATCPACGLLCDDIIVNQNQPLVRVLANGCTKSIRFFEQPLMDELPQINGEPAQLSNAILLAARLIKASRVPLFAGLSTDVLGFRAVYKLSQRINKAYPVALQHMNSQSMARNMAVLQNTGWQTTTLTEVKNRADVIVCIGTDVVSHNPRFFERFVWLNKQLNQQSSKQKSDAMFTDAAKRSIIYIGEDLNSEAGVSPELKTPLFLPCKMQHLPEVMAALRAIIAGKTLKTETVAGIQMSDLLRVANQLKQAKYAVLAWIAKDLDFPHAELAIESMTEIIALLNQNDINRTGRAAGLMLGGSDGDTSANNANTWLSGLALVDDSSQHGDAAPHDCMVWINSFNADKCPPLTDQPLIVLGNSNSHFSQIPDVFIPIATPGLDCSGTLFRVDSSVVLPLKRIRKNNLPTLSEVINQIENLL